MAELEETFGLDIHDLLPKLVEEHDTDAAAIRFMANKLQRTLDPSIVTVWAKRLDIEQEVASARERRRHSKLLSRF